mmetsp:Transcript_112545/g.359445  ORF Transcript_112545/g.359445 Transcript_112545/m.359445 type:complete len:301 (-) Transcript_112545:788-1690(-)
MTSASGLGGCTSPSRTELSTAKGVHAPLGMPAPMAACVPAGAISSSDVRASLSLAELSTGRGVHSPLGTPTPRAACEPAGAMSSSGGNALHGASTFEALRTSSIGSSGVVSAGAWLASSINSLNAASMLESARGTGGASTCSLGASTVAVRATGAAAETAGGEAAGAAASQGLLSDRSPPLPSSCSQAWLPSASSDMRWQGSSRSNPSSTSRAASLPESWPCSLASISGCESCAEDSKGKRPTRSTKRRMPRHQRSELKSCASPRSTSGAVYGRVPTVERASLLPSPTALASPKSAILTL